MTVTLWFNYVEGGPARIFMYKTLAAARKKARTDAEKLADGVDPMAVRREEKERRPQHVCRERPAIPS